MYAVLTIKNRSIIDGNNHIATFSQAIFLVGFAHSNDSQEKSTFGNAGNNLTW